MPTSQAIRLCPQAVVPPVRMSRYIELSEQIHKIFNNYSPEIEPISLDEAFIDVTGSLKLFGSAEKIGREIKNRIKQELGLTASVGIAPNKFLAKLASDLEKPDGFVIITEENKQQIIDPLNVSRIWGIGKVTTKVFAVRESETGWLFFVSCTRWISSGYSQCAIYSSRHPKSQKPNLVFYVPATLYSWRRYNVTNNIS